jgi:hypothetical protein
MSQTRPIQTVAPPGLSLRWIGDGDLPFLEDVYASTREEEPAPVPWSAEQKRAFLGWQFTNQHQYYQQYYPRCEFLVVERAGAQGEERLGRLYVDRWPHQIRLVDIALLAVFRGAEIGGALLRSSAQATCHDSCRGDEPSPGTLLAARLSSCGFERHLLLDAVGGSIVLGRYACTLTSAADRARIASLACRKEGW